MVGCLQHIPEIHLLEEMSYESETGLDGGFMESILQIMSIERELAQRLQYLQLQDYSREFSVGNRAHSMGRLH